MLHIYETQVERIVADSQEHARDLYCAQIGEQPQTGSYEDEDSWENPDGVYVDAWEQMPDDKPLTLHVDADRQIPECGYTMSEMHVETRTYSEWAEHFGAGEFWSTEC